MGCLDENTAVLFMQGSLPAEGARAVESHLDGCHACGSLLAEVARLYVSSASSFQPHAGLRPFLGPAPAVLSSGLRPDGRHGRFGQVRSEVRPTAPTELAPARPWPSSAPPPPTPTGAVGRYHLAGLLGAGGMGVVFAAFDPMLRRHVALKLVRPDLTGSTREDVEARLVGEAQAVARVAHPNVVAVYDVGVVGGHVFFAMELVEGPTLRQWLTQATRSVPEIVDVMVQAGRGLAAIHAAGLVHCDVKPDNVIVGLDGRTRVSDLGLAAAARSGGSGFGGTPSYMSPERLQGFPPTPASDQWSFAVTLYEALYGQRPGAEPVRPRASHVPGWLDALVGRALSGHPGLRYGSMAELVESLGGEAKRGGPVHVRASMLMQGVLWLGHAAFFGGTALNAWLNPSATTSPSSPSSPTPGSSSSGLEDASIAVIILLLVAIVTWGPLSLAWIPLNVYGLTKRRAWARMSTLLYGALSIFTCAGLPFGAYLIYAMTRSSVRAELDR